MCNHRWGLWARSMSSANWGKIFDLNFSVKPANICLDWWQHPGTLKMLCDLICCLFVLLIWYPSADACPYSLVSSLSSWMTYYLAQIYFSLSFQTTTEKRPLVTKSSTAASNQTGSATRNTSAATAASKTAAPVRTAGSTRTTTTAAAKKPLGMCVAFFTLGLFIYCVDRLHDWQMFKHFLFSL